MRNRILLVAALLAAPATALAEPTAAPSPGEIVAAATESEWVAIAPDDLLVMDLAPDRESRARRVVIQLMPPPFSRPWIANIRTLARAHWWDGLAIVRAQDNYVVQWGDPEAEDAAKAKALPDTLEDTSADEYVLENGRTGGRPLRRTLMREAPQLVDSYADRTSFEAGFPIAMNVKSSARIPKAALSGMATVKTEPSAIWPVHCYGTVGVGRNLSPDAGSGAELYAVIGHAPRHLDRNIAVVGRVIEGIEHLSTLPRGTEALGFYKSPEERTPITSIVLGSEIADLPVYQYLSTEGETFARYEDARSNRRDPFFIVPAGGADVCNIPVPVRRAPAG